VGETEYKEVKVTYEERRGAREHRNIVKEEMKSKNDREQGK
jgi:hypothetical protein